VLSIKLVALSAVIFVAFKFLFWTNATIFLGVMGRVVPQSYWRWPIPEIVLSGVASVSFAAEMVLRTQAVLLPFTFMASALAWLAYMSRRVWLNSRPR